MKRTHTCGDIRIEDTDKKAVLQGWVQSRRDHGGLIFIDLRDRYGLTQVTFDPNYDKEAHALAQGLRREDVVTVTGYVRKRKEGMANPKLLTGDVEVFSNELVIENKAETPPIEIDDRIEANEDIRLKYRYLDLRKVSMQKNLILRHKVAQVVRNFYDKNNFLEIETPILAKATPEGARDYLVPSRVNPGKFFALPQSPQLFKQLLMMSSFDRYFQIIKCFRDEDLRADRQPEFTQIDVEMSFVEEEDIYAIHEKLMKEIWKKVLDVDIPVPFPRMPYKEAMERFGSDKPDTRFGLELVNISDDVKGSDFKVFNDVISSGGKVMGINVKKSPFSRKEIDAFIEFVKIYDAKGLAWMKVTENGLESSVVKFFNDDYQNKIKEKMGAETGDLLLFVADPKLHITYASLGALRVHIAKKMKLIDTSKWSFLWVTEFPMLEFDEDSNRHVAVHHPFTQPHPEDVDKIVSDPGNVRARAYDLTLNGVELGGGSIRIHRTDVQEKVFNALGISSEEADEKFGFLLDALKYGAPPHGGIAFGFDRMISLMTGNESIREVIAFPKTKNAESLLDGAPSDVYDNQLKELHMKLDFVQKKKNVVFEKIIDSLNKDKIEHNVIEHKAVSTSEEAAEVRGTELKQGTKALILKSNHGFVQACVTGDSEIDIEKLKKVLKSDTLEMATPKEVKKVSECNIGSVPPFGNLFGLKVYFDKKVSENSDVAFNAGSHTKSIKMKSKDLIKVTGGQVAEFSK